MGLSVEDVDDLRDWWDGEREGDSTGSMLGRLDATVAEIVARHVRAALTEAADRMPAFHDRDVPEWAITSACKWLRKRADALTPDT